MRRTAGGDRLVHVAALALAAVLLALPVAARINPVIVWFTPGPGTLDMLQLFQDPGAWPNALARLSVFKFYQGQIRSDPSFEPNTYQALRAVDAFRTLTQVWHKRTAIEVGVVKEQYCSSDASGNDAAIRDTLSAIEAVRQAGGRVDYLAIDEPFFAGLTPACGSGDTRQTLDRLQRYYANVRLADPEVQIGLIEPYPAFSVVQILDFVKQMASRGIQPAFFHLDADLWQFKKGSDTYAQDLPLLQSSLFNMRVRFGVIFWGHSGDSDALYYQDALQLIRRTSDALPDTLPHDAIFQSWAVSRTGARITPTNLPETGQNTHTALILAGLQLLRRP